MTDGASSSSGQLRIRIFIDFWNFQLALQGKNNNAPFFPDWAKVGPILASEASRLLAAPAAEPARYDGMMVYLSYNPKSEKDRGLRNWAKNTLDLFPGVQVRMRERKPKAPPRCPACHAEIATCPYCHAGMWGSQEKGVDTAIATDMVQLAWERAYDVGVLASGDADFIPAVQFLTNKGVRIIQAGFPPRGIELARTCWASFNVEPLMSSIARLVANPQPPLGIAPSAK